MSRAWAEPGGSSDWARPPRAHPPGAGLGARGREEAPSGPSHWAWRLGRFPTGRGETQAPPRARPPLSGAVGARFPPSAGVGRGVLGSPAPWVPLRLSERPQLSTPFGVGASDGLSMWPRPAGIRGHLEAREGLSPAINPGLPLPVQGQGVLAAPHSTPPHPTPATPLLFWGSA